MDTVERKPHTNWTNIIQKPGSDENIGIYFKKIGMTMVETELINILSGEENGGKIIATNRSTLIRKGETQCINELVCGSTVTRLTRKFPMNVNKDIFENRWEQIRAQSKVWWGLFSDEDLNRVEKAPIKRDKYVMMLRVKYGYTHEGAREEISKRLTDLDANPSGSESTHASLDRQVSSKVSKVRKSRTTKSNP